MSGIVRVRRSIAVAAVAGLVSSLSGISPAHAQSSPSPYAGSWHGQSVIWGPTICGQQASPSCTLTRPWSGTVDENGLFTYVYGPGGRLCPDGSYTPDPGGDSHQVLVPPSGAVQLGYWSENCLRKAQFSASPVLAVSSSLLECSYQYVSQPSGTVCTHTVSATFTGSGKSSAFPMTVTSNIGATVSSATASIRYRAQDVGTSASVYAFAVAPATLAKAAREDAAPLTLGFARSAGKDSPVACVLAQLDASGQLRAVSASQLQAYFTGVLSSQGQSVTILDNVATANIGGAVFYVGYGATPVAMLDDNVLNRAVLVPGAVQCDPQPPQTGWWWNAAEDGRGYTIESTGSKVFFAAYLYDISGRSTWYIAAGPTTLEGSLFVGDLESYSNGQTLTGAFRSPVRPPVLNGQVTLAFNDSTHGTMVWPGGTVPITRMEFGVGGVNAVPLPSQPENGWWLSGLDDGRGFFIEWQAGIGFMAGFMYDDTGAPVWYIAAKTTPDNPQAFSSQWEKYVNGQTLTGAYHPPVRPPTYVGAATIQFQGAETAIMTMPGGRQVNLSRYRF